MTISYPLSLPSNLTPSATTWYAANVVAQSLSPFSMKSQTLSYGGEAWRAEISLDPMPRTEVGDWLAFLTALRGKHGTFLLGNELTKTPQGTGAGSPLVNGASQTGYSLVTDGWTPSSNVLKPGDFIQIDNSLYMNLVNVTASGGGAATLDIWPSLRGHADNATIITSNPKCLMRLADNVQTIIDTPQTSLFSISFGCEEAR